MTPALDAHQLTLSQVHQYFQLQAHFAPEITEHLPLRPPEPNPALAELC